MNDEIERFSKDIARDVQLREQLKRAGTDPEQVVRFANSHGYRFSMEDVDRLTRGDGQELSESDLEKVTGGVAWMVVVGSSTGYVYATQGKRFVWLDDQ
jgi:predicted ribosomally synthesized peptide with nif11-like leader